MFVLNYLKFLLFVSVTSARIVLPKVPDILHPPVPDGINKIDDGHLVYDDDDDPEISPGLFQGDMAMDNVMHNYWKVGLR